MRRGLIAALVVSIASMVAAPADAGVLVGQTELNIHVQETTVTGMLVGVPQCRGDQTIELWVGALVTTTTTDAFGNYAFAYTTVPPTTVQTRFAGSQSGQHPDRSDCTPSDSRVVTVDKVPTANGPAKVDAAAAAVAHGVQGIAMQVLHAFAGHF